MCFLILYAFDVSWPFNRLRRLLEDIIEEICDTIVVRNCEYDLHAGEACEGMGKLWKIGKKLVVVEVGIQHLLPFICPD